MFLYSTARCLGDLLIWFRLQLSAIHLRILHWQYRFSLIAEEFDVPFIGFMIVRRLLRSLGSSLVQH